MASAFASIPAVTVVSSDSGEEVGQFPHRDRVHAGALRPPHCDCLIPGLMPEQMLVGGKAGIKLLIICGFYRNNLGNRPDLLPNTGDVYTEYIFNIILWCSHNNRWIVWIQLCRWSKQLYRWRNSCSTLSGSQSLCLLTSRLGVVVGCSFPAWESGLKKV